MAEQAVDNDVALSRDDLKALYEQKKKARGALSRLQLSGAPPFADAGDRSPGHRAV